ncbi:MAG: hypothetical protein AAFR88_00055 [Pseudomonadota bacterium]
MAGDPWLGSKAALADWPYGGALALHTLATNAAFHRIWELSGTFAAVEWQKRHQRNLFSLDSETLNT